MPARLCHPAWHTRQGQRDTELGGGRGAAKKAGRTRSASPAQDVLLTHEQLGSMRGWGGRGGGGGGGTVQALLGAVWEEMNGKAPRLELDGVDRVHLHQHRALNHSTRGHSARIRHPTFPVSSQHLHLPPGDGIRAPSSQGNCSGFSHPSSIASSHFHSHK